MWTLIALFVTTMGSGSSAMTSVPCFATEQLCKQAGHTLQVGNERRIMMSFCVATSEDNGGWATATERRLCGKLRSAGQECF